MSKFQKILSNLGLAGLFLSTLFPGEDTFLVRWSVDWTVLVSVPSLTVKVNSKEAATPGAMKVGF